MTEKDTYIAAHFMKWADEYVEKQLDDAQGCIDGFTAIEIATVKLCKNMVNVLAIDYDLKNRISK